MRRLVGAPRLGRHGPVRLRRRHGKIRRDLRGLIEKYARRGVVLDLLQGFRRLDVMGRPPGVLALQTLALELLAFRLAGLEIQGQGLLAAYRIERGDILAQVAEIRAVRRALIVQLLQRGRNRLQIALGAEGGGLDMVPGQGRDRACSRRLRSRRSGTAMQCPGVTPRSWVLSPVIR